MVKRERSSHSLAAEGSAPKTRGRPPLPEEERQRRAEERRLRKLAEWAAGKRAAQPRATRRGPSTTPMLKLRGGGDPGASGSKRRRRMPASPSPSPSPSFSSSSSEEGVLWRPEEFVVVVREAPHRELKLPSAFAGIFSSHRPAEIGLRQEGCHKEAVRVGFTFRSACRVSLMRGWSSFAAANKICEGDILYFHNNGRSTLFVKVFDESRCQATCCVDDAGDSSSDE